jgi:60S ribosome subunit biogenesis protein NIP7
MRSLTETETRTLFTKLAGYTGKSLTSLIDTASDTNERSVFRLHESRVYYVPLSIANLATSVSRDALVSLGTCLGKFTKTGKFRLHITSLELLAQHARYKVWIKPNGEMPFLYGGHVVKAHVGRWSEDCPEHQGVVVLNMADVPLVRIITFYENTNRNRDLELLQSQRLKQDNWIQLVLQCLDNQMQESTFVTKIRYFKAHELQTTL